MGDVTITTINNVRVMLQIVLTRACSTPFSRPWIPGFETSEGNVGSAYSDRLIAVVTTCTPFQDMEEKQSLGFLGRKFSPSNFDTTAINAAASSPGNVR